jgi:RNA polymerase sigma factor (sigma-70 family)
MREKTDGELMRLVAEKQRPALEELYNRYVKLVYSFALKSTRDEHSAREIVQLVYTRLWTTSSGYDSEKGRFVNWMITITRNICIDYNRKQRRQEHLRFDLQQLEQVPSSQEEGPEAVLNQKWMKDQIQAAYRHLSESQIQLLELLYWEGYTLSEIADRNREPLGTVKSRLHQCLKVLRRHLTQTVKEGFR